jgi:membrane associated rhomboid family serine protease
MIPLRATIPSQHISWVNYIVISLNLAVFCYELTLGPHLGEFLFTYGWMPRQYSIGEWYHGPFRLTSLVTSMFLHGGWLHLFGNMLYLYIFGRNVEDRLGHFAYLCFYLLSGVVAALTQTFVSPVAHVPMIGASGAIAGVLGAYFLFFPLSRVVMLVPLLFSFQVVRVPAVLYLLLWFLLQLFSGISTLGNQAAGGVAWWAHMGGFVAGLTLAPLLGTHRRLSRLWARRRRRGRLEIAGILK